jgi:hypothetical protein
MVGTRYIPLMTQPNLLLGVNIDHVVTLRQARYRTMLDSPFAEPSVLTAALESEERRIRQAPSGNGEEARRRVWHIVGVRAGLPRHDMEVEGVVVKGDAVLDLYSKQKTRIQILCPWDISTAISPMTSFSIEKN